MKTIKTVTLLALVLSASFAARAANSYWVELNTKACDKAWMGKTDKYPSTADANNYSVYYCTAEAAQQMFGATDVAGVSDYLTEHLGEGMDALKTYGTAVDQSSLWWDGQYTFTGYWANPIDKGSYLAVLAYGQLESFRVFGSENALCENGTLTFDDAGAAPGSVGAWTAVPEPTSGLLLLLGVAGLALKRKRA